MMATVTTKKMTMAILVMATTMIKMMVLVPMTMLMTMAMGMVRWFLLVMAS